MKNYLVTGAAGFIGSHLAKTLIDEGNKVTTIDNLSTGFESNIPEKCVFIKGDCSSEATIEKLNNQKFDAVFHIAGQSGGMTSFDNPIYDLNSNVASTLLLLDYLRKTGGVHLCTQVQCRFMEIKIHALLRKKCLFLLKLFMLSEKLQASSI